MVQPNRTTRSLAASDFSVKRQKRKNGLKGEHKYKNKKKTVAFDPICVIKTSKTEKEECEGNREDVLAMLNCH